ncbi:hypothetical protein D3C75_692230 [compost metagenome]
MGVGNRFDGGHFVARRFASLSPVAGNTAAAGFAPGCRGKCLAAENLPADYHYRGGGVTGIADGRQHAFVGGAGGYGRSGGAMRYCRLGRAAPAQKADAKKSRAAPGCEPIAAPAVGDTQSTGGVLTVVYVAGVTVGATRRSARSLAATTAAGKPELFPAQHRHRTGAAGERIFG